MVSFFNPDEVPPANVEQESGLDVPRNKKIPCPTGIRTPDS